MSLNSSFVRSGIHIQHFLRGGRWKARSGGAHSSSSSEHSIFNVPRRSPTDRPTDGENTFDNVISQILRNFSLCFTPCFHFISTNFPRKNSPFLFSPFSFFLIVESVFLPPHLPTFLPTPLHFLGGRKVAPLLHTSSSSSPSSIRRGRRQRGFFPPSHLSFPLNFEEWSLGSSHVESVRERMVL